MTPLSIAELRAREIVDQWAKKALFCGWMPGGSLVLGAADWAMINRIAQEFEVYDYNRDSIITAIGGALTAKWTSECLSAIPVLGWIAKGFIARWVTRTLGTMMIEYFRDLSPLQRTTLAA
ncbi:MAG TPA: hypothetical protein VFB21_14310 [Chthonomonadaceae bacterium]|nr:hypothetical protein [Chthonomonadaceae bacterium]